MPDSERTVTKFVEHPKPKPRKSGSIKKRSEYLDDYYKKEFIALLFAGIYQL